jgi:hypothetical protein
VKIRGHETYLRRTARPATAFCAAMCLCAVASLCAGSATAQGAGELGATTAPQGGVAILETGGDASAVQRQAAESAVRDALKAAGMHVVDRAAEGAAPQVRVQVWKASKLRRTAKVSVIFTEPGGEETSADVEARAGDGGEGAVAAAAREALGTVLARRSLRVPVQVEVASDPIGALATLDTQPLGVTPLATEVLPGAHTLTLALDGYEALRVDMDVLASGERAQRFEYTLVRSADAAGGSEPALRRPMDGTGIGTVVKVVAGGALIALGAVLLIKPIATLAYLGNKPSPGTEVSFGAVSGTFLALGALAIGGGTLILVW